MKINKKQIAGLNDSLKEQVELIDGLLRIIRKQRDTIKELQHEILWNSAADKPNMFPRQFVEWMLLEEIFYGDLNEEYFIKCDPRRFKSLDEVFAYWLENIKE